jgi:hypothetical protein
MPKGRAYQNDYYYYYYYYVLCPVQVTCTWDSLCTAACALYYSLVPHHVTGVTKALAVCRMRWPRYSFLC